MSNFKIILTAVFAICIVVGLALFALSKASSSSQAAHLTIWGTITPDAFNQALAGSSLAKDKTTTMTYVQKDPTTIDADFVNALSDGKGPDIILLRDDELYKNRNKLFVIPYQNFSERDFKDRFIEGSEADLTPDGVLALPFIVDPLVMYWNRDMFSNNLIARPPRYWDELYSSGTSTGLIETMTKRDSSANITQTALAFGEWSNVTNAKEIISMLFFQAGTPITVRNSVAGASQPVSVVLNSQADTSSILPSQAAINFYTQFSNPTSPAYSWNRSLPSSQNFFLAGNLAMYFGFASEILSIQQKNPNLNFDVTYVPQVRNTPKQTVFGHIYSLAIVKQSAQVGPAFTAINALTDPAALTSMEKITNLPPVRRDLLAAKPTDAFRVVFYNSALLAHTWIDPDPVQSTAIFRTMIESITSGRSRVSETLGGAQESLSALFR